MALVSCDESKAFMIIALMASETFLLVPAEPLFLTLVAIAAGCATIFTGTVPLV